MSERPDGFTHRMSSGSKSGSAGLNAKMAELSARAKSLTAARDLLTDQLRPVKDLSSHPSRHDAQGVSGMGVSAPRVTSPVMATARPHAQVHVRSGSPFKPSVVFSADSQRCAVVGMPLAFFHT